MKEIAASEKRRVQILDTLLMCMLYIVQASVLGFVMAFLLDLGCTSSEVGVMTAAFAVLTAILQPMLGRLSDRSLFFDWKKQLFIIAACTFLISSLAVFLHEKVIAMILFGLILTGVNCMCPFVFASSFYYERFQIAVDFGKIRALGSVSYALGAYAVGVLIGLFGNIAVPVSVAVTTFIFAVIVVLLPRYEEEPLNYRKEKKEDKDTRLLDKKDRVIFPAKYPAFIAMVIAVFLILYVHNVLSGFLAQIVNHAGGDTSVLGTCGAIGAASEVPVIFFFSKLAQKFTVSRMILFGAVGFVIRAVVFLFAESVPMVMFGAGLSMISYAVIAPAIVYFADNSTEKEDKVTGQSYMTMALTIASIAANLVSGFVYDAFGYTAMILTAVFVGILGIFATLYAMQKDRAEKAAKQAERG